MSKWQNFFWRKLVKMAQDAFSQFEQGKDPKQDRNAAWEHFERLRDPRRGAGVDEEPICGGRAELAFNGRRLSFPEA